MKVNNEDYPGKILPSKISEIIVLEFRERFFVSGKKKNWKGEKRPGWTEIKDNMSETVLDGKIQSFINQGEFYVYFEFANVLCFCKQNEIINYFETKPPWVELDMYIFDKSMNWSLVITHDSEMIFVSD